MNYRHISAFRQSLFQFKRWFNFFTYKIRVGRRPLIPGYLPYVLDIEPTTACNFRCRMCQVSAPGFKHTHMPFDLFKEIIDGNPQLFKIKLQGMGEPFTHPHIFEMIAYAVKKKMLVEVITNGSFFTEENIEKIVSAGMTKLTVSMDGATATTFEKIRVGSNFEEVLGGVKKLVRALRERKVHTRLCAWTVLQNENVTEAEALVRLCREIGFAELTFQGQLTAWGKSDWSDRNKGFEVSLENRNQAGYLDRALALGVDLNFPTHVYTGGIYSFNEKCPWPWHSAYIDCRGNVVPCCIIADSSVKSFGVLEPGNLASIWKEENYQEFRRSIKTNEIPRFCQNCYQEYKKL